jgi:hypothetical protein
MDPTSNLNEQRALITEIKALVFVPRKKGEPEPDPERCFECGQPAELEDKTNRLIELVEALDAWLTQGGFLPWAWADRA